MNPFAPYEVEMIRARYPLEGAKSLARELGRSVQVIYNKASALGLRCPATSGRHYAHALVWTTAEDRAIREHWPRIYRHEITIEQLAAQLRRPAHQLQRRAVRLGVTIAREPERAWTEEEIEYLCEHASLGLDRLYKRFKARGWQRTKIALSVKLSRLGHRARGENTATYSASGLAELLGIGADTVVRWIKRNWLPAEPRTAAQGHGGTPAEWLIFPSDVARFLREHTAQVDLSRADKFWLVDLLSEAGK